MLDAAWLLQKNLQLGGLVSALAGVAIFGWHFVRLNAAAARGDSEAIPVEALARRRRAFGYSIFAAGVTLAVASNDLSAALPNRY